METVLVTGATGFIGSNLCLELESRGYRVLATDNYRTSKPQNLEGFGGSLIELDTRDIAKIKDPLYAIFHHGDITDPRFPNDNEVYDHNLNCFKAVAELAAKNRATLVFASTAGLYGNGPVPMHEDQPKDIVTAYGRSKQKMEDLAVELSKVQHIVGLRYFNVFGPRESHKGRAASMIYHLSNQIVEGKTPRLFKHGHHKRDFVYVKDVVAANLCALQAPSGIYNVGTGVATSFKELVGVIDSVLGTHSEIEYFDMPYDPKTYQNDTQADTARARRQLGLEINWPLAKAVRDYLQQLHPNSVSKSS